MLRDRFNCEFEQGAVAAATQSKGFGQALVRFRGRGS